MKSIKIIALFLVVLSVASSCSKSQKEILTTTTWYASKFVAVGTDYAGQACVKDNPVTFSATKITMTPGGVACTPEINLSFDYTLAEDAKTMTLVYPLPGSGTPLTLNMTINTLTDKLLNASCTTPVPVTLEFTAK